MRHIHCGLGANAAIGLRHAGCHRLRHIGQRIANINL
jgi:hypothetical protein